MAVQRSSPKVCFLQARPAVPLHPAPLMERIKPLYHFAHARYLPASMARLAARSGSPLWIAEEERAWAEKHVSSSTRAVVAAAERNLKQSLPRAGWNVVGPSFEKIGSPPQGRLSDHASDCNIRGGAPSGGAALLFPRTTDGTDRRDRPPDRRGSASPGAPRLAAAARHCTRVRGCPIRIMPPLRSRASQAVTSGPAANRAAFLKHSSLRARRRAA